jgi:P-type E1-E2 ATPase
VQSAAPHSERDLLRLAGAVEQYSGHPLARSLVDAAVAAGATLPAPSAVQEAAGRGVSGIVEGHRVAVGTRGYIVERLKRNGATMPSHDGAVLRAFIAVDDILAGAVDYADRIRPEAQKLITELRRMGIRQTVLLSGDSSPNVAAVAREVGVDHAEADLLPADKEGRIAELSARVGRVMMVGDGTNDAPALGRADVGIALAGHGGGITTEAADIVILVDDLARVSEALAISRRTMRIARQSIWVGLSLSGAAMLFAAAGGITPVVGALFQEAIDVAVILNALRASSGGRATS